VHDANETTDARVTNDKMNNFFIFFLLDYKGFF
jgi:hypothetical protein